MVKSLSCVQPFATPWTVAYQASHLWDSPGKNMSVDYHFLLQGIFPTQARVATREESGVLGFPSRRGLTPRGSLECNPEIPAFPGEEN